MGISYLHIPKILFYPIFLQQVFHLFFNEINSLSFIRLIYLIKIQFDLAEINILCIYLHNKKPCSSQFIIININYNSKLVTSKAKIKFKSKLIKANFPPIFFKGSATRNSSTRSPLDNYCKNFSQQKQLGNLKQPQTQRKITSYQNLPSTQLDQPNQFDLMKTDVLKFNLQNKNIVQKKLFIGQNFIFEDKFMIQEIKNARQKAKNKIYKRKQISNKNKPNQHLSKKIQNKRKNQGSINKKNMLNTEQFNQNYNIVDMNCTFGKGFKKCQSHSLQNSKVLHNQSQNTQNQIEQQIERQTSLENLKNIHKHSRQQKSTEESQIMDVVRSGQNQFIKKPPRRRLFITEQLRQNIASHLTSRQSSRDNIKIQWNSNNMNKDLYSLGDIHIQKSKEVFTSQQKQRNSKLRTLNSSIQSRSLKKDKKFQDLNLPKIDKIINLS